MPNPAQVQSDRQNAIRRLLRSGPAATQQRLVDELTALGFHATQSSVSRDLKDLGVIKTANGYVLPSPHDDAGGEMARVADLILGMEAAGPNLLVIKTTIGAAQQVALALDRCGWNEIVGNIGGDDTVFTAISNAAAQRSLIGKIERAATRA